VQQKLRFANLWLRAGHKWLSELLLECRSPKVATETASSQQPVFQPASQPSTSSAPLRLLATFRVPLLVEEKKETGKMYKNVPARHSFPPLSPPSCALTRKSRQNVSVTAQQQPAEIQDNRAKRAKDDKRIFITGVCL